MARLLLPARIALPFGGLSMAAATVVVLVALPLGIVVYTGLMWLLDRKLFHSFWQLLGMALRPGAARLEENKR